MEYSKEFEVFWKLYPGRYNEVARRKVKRKKSDAGKVWNTLSKEIQHEILTKAKFIKDFEGKYPSDPVVWLRRDGWDDITFPDTWVPQLPEELTDVCEAPKKALNMGTRRTALIRQFNAAK